jgi:hypothetical protein
VTAPDYFIWNANNGSGTTWQQGDANSDGRVDIRDFLIWWTNNGRSYDSAPPVGATVPESGTVTLLVVGLLSAAVCTWQKRRHA